MPTSVAGLIVLILLLIGAVLMAPVLSIWSLNVLFGLAIPVTLKTYFSAFWLNALVYGATRSSNK